MSVQFLPGKFAVRAALFGRIGLTLGLAASVERPILSCPLRLGVSGFGFTKPVEIDDRGHVTLPKSNAPR